MATKSTTKVKAIFKGRDGSLGYRKGFEYTLTIGRGVNGELSIKRADIKQGDLQLCPYSSFIGFLNNWDCIRNI